MALGDDAPDTLPPDTLPPLTTRSIVLSLLLGYDDPQQLTSRELVGAGERLGVTGNAMRVTLSRMVAAGDLVRSGGGYGLPSRLLERQRRQSAALHPEPRAWSGAWHVVVVTQAASSQAERLRRRQTFLDLRLGQARDGVWMRPDNLDLALPGELDDAYLRFTGPTEGDPALLAEELWDISQWSRTAHSLLDRLRADHGALEQMTVAAAMVRHLRRDPVLPDELLPADWAGAELREVYARYRREVIELQSSVVSDARPG